MLDGQDAEKGEAVAEEGEVVSVRSSWTGVSEVWRNGLGYGP
jgi:hypothetical protein